MTEKQPDYGVSDGKFKTKKTPEEIKKNLLKKPKGQDWLILVILLLTFAMVLMYMRDINALKEVITEQALMLQNCTVI